MTINATISHPTHQAAKILTKEDVWGNHELKTTGMVVSKSGETCKYWGDKLPFKSVTIRIPSEQKELVNEVRYWLEYVHGAGCINVEQSLPDGSIIIRSDYQCW